MTTVADVARWLEEFAPSRLAESWDNVGLLLGDPAADVRRVVTCLTVTTAVAHEAIDGGAELIVSHHPILFKAAQRIRADRPDTRPVWDLARAGVSVLSPHTAFDNTRGGINDGLSERLGLVDVRPLRATAAPAQCKVVVFTPESDHEKVLATAFSAGAGRIGAYDECSFAIPGEGTFFGTESTNPTVGQAGRREAVRELRVEMVCPSERLADVLAAIRAAHSYEEPAIDVYPLQPLAGDPGVGRVGRLPSPTTLRVFVARVGSMLGSPHVQAAGRPDRPVERIAIGCGAGDDFLPEAARAGADVLLTGEARFHRALEAEALDVGLVLVGHHATERPGVESLAGRIAAAFPALEVWASRSEAGPLWSPDA